MSTGVFTSMTRSRTARMSFASFATALVITLFAAITLSGPADARLGMGGSFGSRASRTFSMPSSTPTAPSISPITRSQTSAPFNSGFGAPRPSVFGGGGFGRGLLGGFLGAGLFGLLFGHGLFGGLGGGTSLIGLLLQVGLLYLAFRFFMNMFRRGQPSFGGGMFGGTSMFGGQAPFQAGGQASGFGGGGGAPRGVPIQVGPADYQAFEQRLVESQAAYSNGDIGTLRRLATPEMAGNFAEELAGNERQGVVNKLSDVRLLQGDLSEAWREGGADYASVAMRFSLVDTTLERASGRIVAGNPGVPQTVAEVWTFARPSGAGPDAWALSAIQQAA